MCIATAHCHKHLFKTVENFRLILTFKVFWWNFGKDNHILFENFIIIHSLDNLNVDTNVHCDNV